MSLTAKMPPPGEGAKHQIPPAGTHIARCYSVIDLGTQTEHWEGDIKFKPKVRFTWELPEETAVFKEENGPQPFVVSQEYTVSLFDKANLRQVLESWTGKDLEGEETFPLETLAGLPCMVTLVHRTSKKTGNPFAKVTGVSGLPKGTACPRQVNPSVIFDIDDGRSNVFKSLPEFLQKKIEASEEWNVPAVGEPEIRGDEVPF